MPALAIARLPMPPDIHYVNCRRIVQQPTGHDADAGLIGQAAKFPDHRDTTAFQRHFELHRNCRSLDFPWDASIFSLRSSLIQNAGAGVPAPGLTARAPCRRPPNRARKRAPTTSRSPGAVASRPSHQLPDWSRNFRGTSSARGWTASHCFTADTIAHALGVRVHVGEANPCGDIVRTHFSRIDAPAVPDLRPLLATHGPPDPSYIAPIQSLQEVCAIAGEAVAIIRVNVNSAQETALVIIRGIAVMVSLQSTRRFSSSEANGGCHKHPVSTEARYRRGATPRRSGGCRSSNPAHPARQPRPADDGAVARHGASVKRARGESLVCALRRVAL